MLVLLLPWLAAACRVPAGLYIQSEMITNDCLFVTVCVLLTVQVCSDGLVLGTHSCG